MPISPKEKFILFLKGPLPWLAGNVLMFILAFLALRQFCNVPQDLSAVMRVFYAWAFALAAGLLAIRLYLPAVAEKMVSTLLFPKKYLSRAPVMLDPIRGLIASGRYSEAESALKDLREENPDHAEIAWMLMDLYQNRLQRPDLAFDTAARFLSVRPRRDSEFYFRVLMGGADLLNRSGRVREQIQLLEQELKRGQLNSTETGSVNIRLNALRKRL